MHELYQFHARRRSAQGRRGAAAVELALCSPLLIVLALGMIETCNLVHLQTRMCSAAYESARLATRPTTSQNSAATSAVVTNNCTALLKQLGVNGANVTLNPSDLSTVAPQQMVTVTITAPLSQNTVTSLVVDKSQTIRAQASLVVE